MIKLKTVFRMASCLIIISLCSYSEAFDNKITHRKITEKSVEESKLDDYLIDYLEISDGFDKVINGKKIIVWLQDGSEFEDKPNCRASNHFHDALRPWTDSHMSDQPWFINMWCSGGEYPPGNIKSAVHWATGYTEPAPDGAKPGTNNQWDWDHAREYYYIYLTGKDYDGMLLQIQKI